jgi:hypothetical protein
MLLRASEHLDNLVWAWHYARHISELGPEDASRATTALARKARSQLERRIEILSRHVTWAKGNPGDRARAHILHDAWLYRKNCPYQFESFKSSTLSDPKIAVAVPDRERLLKGTASYARAGKHSVKTMGAERIYEMRSSSGIDEGPPETMVLLRPGNDSDAHFDSTLKLFVDHDSDEELEFMHALQDYLLDKYREGGLIIETNPTSNLYIAHLRSYCEHPIFRWAPPDHALISEGARYNLYGLRRGPMAVTINTDDPGIMPTTLRTEFLLMGDAGRTQQSPAEIDRWLDDIRKHANEQFKRNHVSVWTDTANT